MSVLLAGQLLMRRRQQLALPSDKVADLPSRSCALSASWCLSWSPRSSQTWPFEPLHPPLSSFLWSWSLSQFSPWFICSWFRCHQTTSGQGWHLSPKHQLKTPPIVGAVAVPLATRGNIFVLSESWAVVVTFSQNRKKVKHPAFAHGRFYVSFQSLLCSKIVFSSVWYQ